MPLFEKIMVLLLTNTFFFSFLELGFALAGIDALYYVVVLVYVIILLEL